MSICLCVRRISILRRHGAPLRHARPPTARSFCAVSTLSWKPDATMFKTFAVFLQRVLAPSVGVPSSLCAASQCDVIDASSVLVAAAMVSHTSGASAPAHIKRIAVHLLRYQMALECGVVAEAAADTDAERNTAGAASAEEKLEGIAAAIGALRATGEANLTETMWLFLNDEWRRIAARGAPTIQADIALLAQVAGRLSSYSGFLSKFKLRPQVVVCVSAFLERSIAWVFEFEHAEGAEGAGVDSVAARSGFLEIVSEFACKHAACSKVPQASPLYIMWAAKEAAWSAAHEGDGDGDDDDGTAVIAANLASFGDRLGGQKSSQKQGAVAGKRKGRRGKVRCTRDAAPQRGRVEGSRKSRRSARAPISYMDRDSDDTGGDAREEGKEEGGGQSSLSPGRSAQRRGGSSSSSASVRQRRRVSSSARRHAILNFDSDEDDSDERSSEEAENAVSALRKTTSSSSTSAKGKRKTSSAKNARPVVAAGQWVRKGGAPVLSSDEGEDEEEASTLTEGSQMPVQRRVKKKRRRF